MVSQRKSTGQKRTQSTELKTRVNVVHAGLSQLLLQWKVCTPSSQRNSLIFPSSNLLIATLHLMVAREDTQAVHSHISKRISKISAKTTRTQLKTEPATLPLSQVKLVSPKSWLSRPTVVLNLWLPLPKVPSLSCLMLGSPRSKCTQVVSSTTPAA